MKPFTFLCFLIGSILYAQETYLLDPAFGNNGVASFSFSAPQTIETFVKDQAIQSDGKVLVCGYYKYYNSTDRNVFVVRFNSNGTVDTSFGTNGYITFTTSSADQMKINLFSDNSFILNMRLLSLRKFLSNGDVDLSFGNNGVLYENLNCDVVIQNDDKFVVVYPFSVSLTYYRFKIQRFFSDGTIDSSYLSNNRDYGEINKYNSARLLLQPDGGITVVHYVYEFFGGFIFYKLFQLSAEGVVGNNTANSYYFPEFFAIQNDMKLLIQSLSIVKRYGADLSLDLS